MILDKERQRPRQGILYIVATPIGNLEDITLRAIRILKEVSLIAAEDTRRTKKLLDAYGIGTPLTSLYEHNELKKSGTLVSRMMEGFDVAYVSDAGTPGISDPGYLLVQKALANGIVVVPVPGACAAIAALSISGLPMDSFVFHGFLPGKSGKRQHFIKSLENETKTMVFYESPNRLMATLHDVKSILGNRQVVVTRELTKIYEEILRGSVEEVIEVFGDRVIKGEITLIIAGKEKMEMPCPEEDIRRLLALYEGATLSKRALIGKISLELGVPRNLVYREAMKAKG
ncbi:MAG: 16S rRNA (cytidine(1402)-2'-O)-methyltransferase [Syntrophales bacterium]|nr:16S rRNA (cytidine(1402)-2'-O)-methyltransferase [Syntrophales bacterium]